MSSQQQPIVVDTLSASPQSGAWASGATVSTSGLQSWKNGDIVYAIVANQSNLTVSAVATAAGPGGGLANSGLGSFAKVTDGTHPASIANSTTLEAELWAATATGDGSGIVTATMSGTGAAGTQIMTFALTGTQATPDQVATAAANAAVVAFPAATSQFGDAQALSIEVVANSNNTPTAQTAYTLIGTVANNNCRIVATLANAYTPTAGTAVTPPVTAASQSSGAPSVALTVLLKPPVPPPTGLTATYTAGVGITLNWTAPAGFTGTGYNVYRTTGASQNGIAKRLDVSIPAGTQAIPWGTTSFIDREVGFSPVNANENVITYYVTTVNNATESPASVTATATWLG